MSENSRKFGRNIFVLDITGSMWGMKCQTLQLSVTRIIEELPDNSYVGVVLYDTITETVQPVIQITDRSVRDAIIARIPAKARGDNDNALGILQGVKELKNGGVATEGATMFFVTDGVNARNGRIVPYLNDVLPTLLEAKIKVVCIAIGNEADTELEELARRTSGSVYATSNTQSREMIARVIECTIQEVTTSTELAEAVITSICDDIIHLTQSQTTKQVTIDSDIGRNTVFNIGSEDFDKISVVIESPNGHKYDMSSTEMMKNNALKRYQLKPKTAEAGVWTITLMRHSNQRIAVNISVKSRPLSEKAVQMKVTLMAADTNSPPIIIAELRRGQDLVVGADVTATIDKPNGTQSLLKLNNYDNIYCNYFTDYCGSGRYNVTVLAQNKLNQCKFKSLSSRTAGTIPVPLFERQLIAGCFKVTTSMPQRPIDDQKLKDLSLSTQFSSFAFNTSVSNIEAPAPRTAKAVIKPKIKAVSLTSDISKRRAEIFELLFVVKKSINSPKINDNQRTGFKKSMEEISTRLDNTTTLEELDKYFKQLDDIKRKVM